MSKKRKKLFSWILLCSLPIILYIFIEIGVSMIWEKRVSKDHVEFYRQAILQKKQFVNIYSVIPHHILPFATNPEYPLHNSFGLRGKEFTIEKPDNVFRIVSMGGSTTYTTGYLTPGYSYPERLEAYLQQHKQGNNYNFEVINAGVGSYSSHEILLQYIFYISELEPDLIIVYTGHNDAHNRIKNKVRSDNSHAMDNMLMRYAPAPGKWIKRLVKYSPTFRLTYLSMLDLNPRIDYEDIAIPAWKNNVYNTAKYFERNINLFSMITNQSKIPVMFALFHERETKRQGGPREYIENDYLYFNMVKEHNEIISKIAKKYNHHVYDFDSDAKKFLSDEMIAGDHIHLVNKDGIDIKAELFGKAVLRYLEERDAELNRD